MPQNLNAAAGSCLAGDASNPAETRTSEKAAAPARISRLVAAEMWRQAAVRDIGVACEEEQLLAAVRCPRETSECGVAFERNVA